MVPTREDSRIFEAKNSYFAAKSSLNLPDDEREA